MDDKIWEDFMEYLRYLIISDKLNENIPKKYKPIVISHFFDVEVYRDVIQSFFEVYLFSFDDVLQAFQIFKMSSEFINIIREANGHKYIMDDELYNQSSDDEEKFEELMEERDLFWNKINKKYCDIKNNNIQEKILDYIKINNLVFDKKTIR